MDQYEYYNYIQFLLFFALKGFSDTFALLFKFSLLHLEQENNNAIAIVGRAINIKKEKEP